MTIQEVVYQVEAYLAETYEFRTNLLSGKTEMRPLRESELFGSDWLVVTEQVLNTIVRQAIKDDIGGGKTPRKHIEEYINSFATQQYDPAKEFLESLPSWDGKNRVAELFSRIPGVNTEQLNWLAIWLRSAVAHWLGMDMLHGNETVPVLIGAQGCGKSTFCTRLLPSHLRKYFLDHINFGNKFDSEMALTHNLLVNIDEFDNMRESQQAKLKQTLSKNKVNGRPIFGRAQEDRRRFASFIATTNEEHPLYDSTGSRRYICIKVADGQIINNESDIDYEQIYAQVLYELKEQKAPFYFGRDDVKRIQEANLPYYKTLDLESMLMQCYRIPENSEDAEWVRGNAVYASLVSKFPSMSTKNTRSTQIKIGKILRESGCKCKEDRLGTFYRLTALTA